MYSESVIIQLSSVSTFPVYIYIVIFPYAVFLKIMKLFSLLHKNKIQNNLNCNYLIF
jgi:hypothetical protein